VLARNGLRTFKVASPVLYHLNKTASKLAKAHHRLALGRIRAIREAREKGRRESEPSSAPSAPRRNPAPLPLLPSLLSSAPSPMKGRSPGQHDGDFAHEAFLDSLPDLIETGPGSA